MFKVKQTYQYHEYKGTYFNLDLVLYDNFVLLNHQTVSRQTDPFWSCSGNMFCIFSEHLALLFTATYPEEDFVQKDDIYE